MRTLGRTRLRVTPLCIGTSPLGNTPLPYKHDAPLEAALDTVRRVAAGPINLLDTGNNYGDAERRIGIVLRELGGIPNGFVLQTKVDRDMAPGDYSGDRVRRSVHESLERLGLERLGLVHLHDPEKSPSKPVPPPAARSRRCGRCKPRGLIAHLGVAGGPTELLRRYIRTGAFAVVLTHNRFSLVDQSAEPLLAEAEQLDVAVLNAAPFGGGVLAGAPQSKGYYGYREAATELLARIEAIEAACRRHEVPLAAAALQFSLRDSRSVSTVVGASRPERIDGLLELAGTSIPPELWDELGRLN